MTDKARKAFELIRDDRKFWLTVISMIICVAFGAFGLIDADGWTTALMLYDKMMTILIQILGVYCIANIATKKPWFNDSTQSPDHPPVDHHRHGSGSASL